MYFHARKCTWKCRLVKGGQFVPAPMCWIKTKNIMTGYWKQNYSRLNYQIKRHPLVFPLLCQYHLSETPQCRSLCECVHICIYTYRLYMYFKIFYGSIECWLFISIRPGQYTWHVRVRRLICRSDEGLLMVWSCGLPVLECRTWV